MSASSPLQEPTPSRPASPPRAWSVELFPPRPGQEQQPLIDLAAGWLNHGLRLLSVTHPADDPDLTRSLALVRALRDLPQAAGCDIVMHLALRGRVRDDLTSLLPELRALAVTKLLCLAGDDEPLAPASPTVTRDSLRLIAQVADAGFEPWAAAYPEGHPWQRDPDRALAFLAEKERAGAQQFVSQALFDFQTLSRLPDRLRTAGVSRPLIIGVLPYRSLGQLRRLAQLCGLTPSPALLSQFARSHAASPLTLARVQERLAQQAGFHRFHLYSFNQADPANSLIARDGAVSPPLPEPTAPNERIAA